MAPAMARPGPRQPSLFEAGDHGDGIDPARGRDLASGAAGSEAVASGAVASDREGPVAATRVTLRCDQLQAWQGRVLAHQAPLFTRLAGQAPGQPVSPGPSEGDGLQGSLFNPTPSPGSPDALADDCNPLQLTPLALDFWRWPDPPHRGASLYFVLDRPADQPLPLLLYVGETGQADRRWKGDHDCKGYLAAYGESLRQAGLTPMLSIRFWCDVPTGTRQRRQLEQALIRRWLPPFNKETRERWATPFTADPDWGL